MRELSWSKWIVLWYFGLMEVAWKGAKCLVGEEGDEFFLRDGFDEGAAGGRAGVKRKEGRGGGTLEEDSRFAAFSPRALRVGTGVADGLFR